MEINLKIVYLLPWLLSQYNLFFVPPDFLAFVVKIIS